MNIMSWIISRRTFIRMTAQLSPIIILLSKLPIFSGVGQNMPKYTPYGAGMYGDGSYSDASRQIYLPIINKGKH